MNVEEALDRYGLRPAPEVVPEIRQLLRQQTQKERACQGSGDTELMKLLCVQLFASGSAADTLLTWEAKRSSMDADASIDIQLLCGRGLQDAKDFLRRQASPLAREALARIEQCEAGGDFHGFLPKETLAFYDDYDAEDGETS